MKTKQIDNKIYFINDEGMIMFALFRPDKAIHSIDNTTDEMWCVKCLYPTGHFGTWKFFEREDAEAWIQDQIDLDVLSVTRRRNEIVNPKRSIEDIFEDFLLVFAEINGFEYGK